MYVRERRFVQSFSRKHRTTTPLISHEPGMYVHASNVKLRTRYTLGGVRTEQLADSDEKPLPLPYNLYMAIERAISVERGTTTNNNQLLIAHTHVCPHHQRQGQGLHRPPRPPVHWLHAYHTQNNVTTKCTYHDLTILL